jgi:hypothetical protein
MIVASFEVNRAVIAKTLCVKRNQTGNSCNGKCYLKKQLDTESKKTNCLSSDKALSETQFIEQVASVFFNLIQISSFYFVPYQKDSPIQLYCSIFHPPRQIS